jgi:murE/murF fusion protein
MLIGDYFHKVNLSIRDIIFLILASTVSSCKKGSIFFAIKGNKFDGNKYIEKAI